MKSKRWWDPPFINKEKKKVGIQPFKGREHTPRAVGEKEKEREKRTKKERRKTKEKRRKHMPRNLVKSIQFRFATLVSAHVLRSFNWSIFGN